MEYSRGYKMLMASRRNVAEENRTAAEMEKAKKRTIESIGSSSNLLQESVELQIGELANKNCNAPDELTVEKLFYSMTNSEENEAGVNECTVGIESSEFSEEEQLYELSDVKQLISVSDLIADIGLEITPTDEQKPLDVSSCSEYEISEDEESSTESESEDSELGESDNIEMDNGSVGNPKDNSLVQPSTSRPENQLNSQLGEQNQPSTSQATAQVRDENSLPAKRKKHKRGRAVPDEWERNRNKLLRMKGEEYKGVKKDEHGKFKSSATKSPRVQGPACNSSKCVKAKNRHCSSFTDDERKTMFDNFWKKMDWSMRKTHVASIVDNVPTKRKQEGKSRRSSTLRYHLKHKDERLQVCKQMFLATLGLKEWMVRDWIKTSLNGSGMHVTAGNVKTPKRNRSTDQTKSSSDFLNDFLQKMPKLPSHYCRASSSKLYLEPIIQSKMELYRLYTDKCKEENVKPLSRAMLSSKFEELNLSIFKPKKDQCDTCVSYKVGNISEEPYKIHCDRKTDARKEKDADRLKAADHPEEVAVFTMDLQAVKLAPCLKASAIYYKTKLCVHNFTLYNETSRDATCYLWQEGEGALEANIFASIIIDFLNNFYKTQNPPSVVLCSDGCCYQNRNATLSNALLLFAKMKNVSVYQKYLEKGHTQMEVDSVHSTIEKRLKNREIYVPTDYIGVCREASVTKPYNVNYLSHTFFQDYSNVLHYTSIRPGFKKGDPVVVDLRCLKYTPDGKIDYKLMYNDDWRPLPKRPNQGPFEVTPLYTLPLKIKKSKYQDLQDLKPVIPAAHWDFYNKLPHA